MCGPAYAQKTCSEPSWRPATIPRTPRRRAAYRSKARARECIRAVRGRAGCPCYGQSMHARAAGTAGSAPWIDLCMMRPRRSQCAPQFRCIQSHRGKQLTANPAEESLSYVAGARRENLVEHPAGKLSAAATCSLRVDLYRPPGRIVTRGSGHLAKGRAVRLPGHA